MPSDAPMLPPSHEFRMSFTRILTHPGGAHKDEFLACCLLLAQNNVSVFRREPTEDDLI